MSDPTPAMKQRSKAWLTVVDHVEAYLTAAAQRYDGIYAATTQLSRDMPQPDDLGDQFAPLGKGGIQDLFAKLWWDLNLPDGKAAENASEVIKNSLLKEVSQLREDLNRTISDFSDMSASFHPSESEVAPTKTAVMRDPSLQKRIDEYLRAVSTAESGKQPEIDPYILKLSLDRKIESSVRKLNRQADSYAYVQDATKRVDGEVTERLQAILRRYTEIVEQNAHIIAGGAQAARSVFVNQPKLFEYKHWLSSSKAPSNFTGSAAVKITQREESSELRYPKENSAYAQAIRVGTLERRTKFLHTYSAGEYVLTPLSLIEIRQNSPVWSIDLVGAKLVKDHKAALEENQFVVLARQHGSSSGKQHSFVFRAKVAANWIRDLEAITTGSLPLNALSSAKSDEAGAVSPSRSPDAAPAYHDVAESKAPNAYPASAVGGAAGKAAAPAGPVIGAAVPDGPESDSTVSSPAPAASPVPVISGGDADPLAKHVAADRAPQASESTSSDRAGSIGNIPLVAPAPAGQSDIGSGYSPATTANTNTETCAEQLTEAHLAKTGHNEPVAAAPITHEAEHPATGKNTLTAAPLGAVPDEPVARQTSSAEPHIPAAPLGSDVRNIDVAAGSLNNATTANTDTSTRAGQLSSSHIGKSDEHPGTWSGEPVSAVPVTHEPATHASGAATLTAAPIHDDQEPAAKQTEAAEPHIAAAPLAPVAGVTASGVTPSAAPITTAAGNKIGDSSEGATTANTSISTKAAQRDPLSTAQSDEHTGTWHYEPISAVPVTHKPTSGASGPATLTAAPIHTEDNSPVAKQTEAAEQHIAAAPLTPGSGADISTVTPSAAPITAASGNKVGDVSEKATTANTDTSTKASQFNSSHIGKSDEHPGTWSGEHVSAVPVTHAPASHSSGAATLTAAPIHGDEEPVAKQTEAAEQHIAAAPIVPPSGAATTTVTPSAAPITAASGNKVDDISSKATTANTDISTKAEQLNSSHIGKPDASARAWHGEPVAAAPVSHEQPAASAAATHLTAYPIPSEAETKADKQTEAAEQHIPAAPLGVSSAGSRGVDPTVAPITGANNGTFDVHAASVNAANTENTDIATDAARRSSLASGKDHGEHSWNNEHVTAIPLIKDATPGDAKNSQFSDAKDVGHKARATTKESNVTPAVIPITAVSNGANDVPASGLNSATTANTHTGTKADKLSAEHISKSGEHLGAKSGWHSEPVAAVPVTHDPPASTPVSLTSAPLATDEEPVPRQTKAAASHIAAAPIPVDSGATASKVTATAAPIPTDSSALPDDSDSEISDVEPYNDEGTLAWKAEKDMAVFDKQ